MENKNTHIEQSAEKVLAGWEAYALSTSQDERNDELCSALAEISKALAAPVSPPDGAMPEQTCEIWRKQGKNGDIVIGPKPQGDDWYAFTIPGFAPYENGSWPNFSTLDGQAVTSTLTVPVERSVLLKLTDLGRRYFSSLLQVPAEVSAVQAALASENYDDLVQHPDDSAVDCFATAMKEKMAKSRSKGRGGWDDPTQCSAETLRAMLIDHLAKGDPVDVGNFAMMLFNRGESTAEPKGGMVFGESNNIYPDQPVTKEPE